MKLSTSKQRGSFNIECELKSVEEGTKTAEEAEQMIGFYRSHEEIVRQREQDPQWRENNLEYDLRSTDWICEKVRASEIYAQNLYAAMCNREFQRNDVWPLLKDQRWSCSWRYAGGIVADMRGEGDYIDWYCSGIRGGADLDAELPKESERDFVSESVVTDEVRADLFQLGWLVVDDEYIDIN